jgi:hypothetical protein
VRGIQLWTFDRGREAAMIVHQQCVVFWCFDLFSFDSVSSTTIDRVNKF